MFAKLWNDEAGFIVSMELLFVATILVLGLITGWAQLENSLKSELVELANAGVQVAVATSKRLAPAQVALTWCGLDGLVDTLVTMEDTIRHKPDPEPLLHAAQRLGVAPEQAAYVGDAAVDLRAARAAGMSGVGVLWGAGTPETLKPERPCALVETVEALHALLLPLPEPAVGVNPPPVATFAQPAGT